MSEVHEPILSALARDLLCGELVFPTNMKVAIAIKNALQDDGVSIDRLTRLVGSDPLISAKLLHMANCVSFNPSGQSVTSLASAISRLGFEVVRAASMVVAMRQLSKSHGLDAFTGLSTHAWQHSIRLAALMKVLAKHHGYPRPDEAMLAGLLSDVGVFYLIYRAADFPMYREEIGLLIELLIERSTHIGHDVLKNMDLPETIVEAQSLVLSPQIPPTSLAEYLSLARLLVDPHGQWPVSYGLEPPHREQIALLSEYGEFLSDSLEEVRLIESALKQ